ncbi:MAG: hypothetical protein FWH23_07500 [Bacteroidales bacterium]|nr:hypothetical protein [Bacteroidales bacterium]MCL2133552.1 hypothetical protein [Bacteroidales bacterium]
MATFLRILLRCTQAGSDSAVGKGKDEKIICNMADLIKLSWIMKNVLSRYKISPLADSLPSLCSRVCYARTATQNPRKIMALAIFLPLPTHCFKQNFIYFCNNEKSGIIDIDRHENIR